MKEQKKLKHILEISKKKKIHVELRMIEKAHSLVEGTDPHMENMGILYHH